MYIRKLRFTAPLARRRKTKFPTVYPTIYLPKLKFLNTVIPYSNALAFVTRLLIGYRQKSATVYPAIYCRRQFDVINYVILRWMTCGITRLATLKFETKLQKCIRMEITIFKIFIWGSISSDIRSKITFYGSARASP